MTGVFRAGLAILVFVAMAPAVVVAQQTSSAVIAGTARDTSGAVLPGVTVEAASPALIEKVRTVVTDSQGQYRITDLRPGVYTVTFTLPGFATVRREELTLPANFTATINSEMRVGGVEETITVTGASPVVDVQNLSTATRVSNEIMDALPTSRELAEVMAFNPGVTVSPRRAAPAARTRDRTRACRPMGPELMTAG